MIRATEYKFKFISFVFIFLLLAFAAPSFITGKDTSDGKTAPKVFSFANTYDNSSLKFSSLSYHSNDVKQCDNEHAEYHIFITDENVQNERYSLTLSESAKKLLRTYSLVEQFDSLIKFIGIDEAADFISTDSTKIFNELVGKYCVEFSESQFLCVSGKTQYISGKDGKRLDKYDFCKNLFSSIDDGTYTVKLNFIHKKAESLDSLKLRTVSRGVFSTSFLSSNENRVSNIKLATEKINGVVIMPQEIFSFNKTVGRRTAENGFKEAKVILDGEFTSGIGGGVCQVSTTLYNCALLSGLEIIEVNQHSLPVTYVAPSLDAMVSDYSDLKFKNNTTSPIFIFGFATAENVRFDIFGVRGKAITITSEISKILPFETSTVHDPQFKVGDIVRKGKNGYESDAYLIYTENGMTVKRKFRHNVYKPQNELIAKEEDSASDNS
ncbi:MAG: VanW family protein [Christensenellales bacterium]